MLKKSSALKKVSHLPFIGYMLRIVWGVALLPKRNSSQNEITHKLQLQIDKTRYEVAESIKIASSLKKDYENHVERLENRLSSYSEQLSDVKHQQLLNQKSKTKTGDIPADSSNKLLVDDHGLDEFYLAFENRFRGSEKEIEKRLEVYIPYLKNLDIDFKKTPVLDIGCGRGEMLGVLAKADINAIGIDLNERMAKKAEEKGFKATQADALTYLMSQPPGSLGAVTGFHLAEHIPFQLLIRIFEESYRVLARGGVLIFETPNPESIHVGSFSFYYDPSHLNPLPPDVLAFTLENRGYDKAEILRLHAKKDNVKLVKGNDDLNEVMNRFFGAQDYAVIGYKSK